MDTLGHIKHLQWNLWITDILRLHREVLLLKLWNYYFGNQVSLAQRVQVERFNMWSIQSIAELFHGSVNTFSWRKNLVVNRWPYEWGMVTSTNTLDSSATWWRTILAHPMSYDGLVDSKANGAWLHQVHLLLQFLCLQWRSVWVPFGHVST